MRRYVLWVAAVVWGVAGSGCADRAPQSPAAPRLSAAVQAGATACSFNSMNPLVSGYFQGNPTEKKQVSGLINAMQAAFDSSDTTTTRDRGFGVMTHIASQVKGGNSDVPDGANLTNALIACMLLSAAERPATFPEDFTIALNPSLDGAYDVRGEPPTDPDQDPGQRVYARPVAFNPTTGFPTHTGFSGVAPSFGSASSPLGWSQIIHTTRPPTRVLLYGRPGANSQSYDWRAVPRNVAYGLPAPLSGPAAIVGFCVSNPTILVHESGTSFTGFNPFVNAYFMDPAICQTFAVRRPAWSPLQLANRLLGVTPLWGFNPDGAGGLVGNHSEFDADLSQMTATFPPAGEPPGTVTVCTPQMNVLNAGCPSGAFFQVAVTTTGSGTRASGSTDTGPLGDVPVHLAAKDNNGTFGNLCELTSSTTFVCEPVGDTLGLNIVQTSGGSPPFAPATFAHLFFTKTGAEVLVANANIPGRSLTGQATSSKVNVKP